MKRGQTLIILLVFMIVAITVTTAAVAVLVANTSQASNVDQGNRVQEVAESGAENALMRLLRNPSYTGETLTVGEDQVTITVTGSNPYTVAAVAESGTVSRTVTVNAEFVDGILTVNSWQTLY